MSDRDPIERLEELLVLQATEGLDPAAERELDRLLLESPGEDPQAVERAAAALDLVFTAQAGATMAPLPADLAARILADAPRVLAAGPATATPSPSAESAAAAEPVSAQSSPARRTPLVLVASGWLAAAAALFLLLWTSREAETEREQLQAELARLDERAETSSAALRELNAELVAARTETADVRAALGAAEQASADLRQALADAQAAGSRAADELDALVAEASTREAALLDRVAELEELLYVPSPETRLQRLLASADDVVRVPWSTTPDPLVDGVDVGGEVIWSDSRQEGYMVFDTMRSNTQLEQQYQLWIFSSTQSPETPVDGGVFDVAASASRIVVPIDAKLSVEDPSLFAVTLEKPGGVVVSSRERLLLLAEV